MAREDVIFYADEINIDDVITSVQNMPLRNEIIHFGGRAICWGKYDEKENVKTVYSKFLANQPCYQSITIRNGNTFNKLHELLEQQPPQAHQATNRTVDKCDQIG